MKKPRSKRIAKSPKMRSRLWSKSAPRANALKPFASIHSARFLTPSGWFRSAARPENMEIVYQFSNGPVSPEYQRNYAAALNKTTAKLRFQRYAKEPTEITVKTGDAKFKEIMALAGQIKLRKDGAKQNDGCAGGSSESLKVSSADKTETFNGTVYHCGATDYGNLVGDTASLKTKITALFPNEEYLKYENLAPRLQRFARRSGFCRQFRKPHRTCARRQRAHH